MKASGRLVFLLFKSLASGKKISYFEVITFIPQSFRVTDGQLGLADGIQEHRIIGDVKNAGQFVRYNYDGGAKTIAQLKYKIIKQL